jgi:hypothetical protein
MGLAVAAAGLSYLCPLGVSLLWIEINCGGGRGEEEGTGAGGAAAAITNSTLLTEALWEAESVTPIDRKYVPARVGVPLKYPDGLMVNPAIGTGQSVAVIGSVPPVSVIWREKKTPTCPLTIEPPESGSSG